MENEAQEPAPSEINNAEDPFMNSDDGSIHRAVYYSAAMASLSSLLFGMTLTVMGCMHPTVQKQWAAYMDDSVADGRWGIVSGNIFLGCLVSNILVNMGKLNKKNVLILNNILHALGYLIFLSSQSFLSMFVGRLVTGLASGITCAIVPVYIAFIAPPKRRGFLLSFHPLGIILGITIGNILATLNSEHIWRIPLFSMLALIVLNMFGLNQIMDISSGAQASNTSLPALLRKKNARKSMFIAMLVHACQHLCGVDYVTLFLGKIFFAYRYANSIVVGISFFAVLVTAAFTKYVDLIGRKPLIIASSLIVGAATAMLAFDFYPTVATPLFMLGYNMGLSSIPWFITSEIFPQKFANPAGLLAVSMNWISAYGAILFLYPLHVRYGNIVFLFYTSCMALFAGLMAIFFSETKGRAPDFQTSSRSVDLAE